ncbi:MAG: DNA mismatch repair protein MutS [Gammaproteobacteria bacterium]|nr:DNA mismatch repair protein MutS [Gammaproteobacteria bacterium]NIR27838.1 DNA mismatch repair protein MutS [Gammaproteobacteria bacterium]NIR96535.1 DNA mismatch repair protein MutS [Gammaproteobacteria bacterium]NIT62273.1 DNA mismatch repair protein MutS [Gammaproteobacteria bacterium]NIV19124.1 DNA mismatch repair protein MutS [Gammaproteobacteria bacterium]
MGDKRYPSPEDAELFRRQVGPVRPVEHDKIEPAPRRPAPEPRKTREDERRVLQDMLSDEYGPARLETGEELVFARPGLQRKVLRKLRRGQFSVQAELDLHGMTVPLAGEALALFLKRCREGGHRCVRIVHGKGHGSSHRGPVLKALVERRLKQRDEVLAFCSALPRDGGTGAVYVLLKRG